MHTSRLPLAIATAFALFWLVVLYLGADHPPPIGFLWLVATVMICAVVVYWRFPTFMAWSKQGKLVSAGRAALEGTVAGLAVALIFLIGHGFSGDQRVIDAAIWLAVLGLVGMLNALTVFMLAAVCSRKFVQSQPSSTAGTPRDYSDQLYRVVFEIGEHEGLGKRIIMDYLTANGHRVDPQSYLLQTTPYGYELEIPMQVIPEIIQALNREKVAVYQVVRIAGPYGSWLSKATVNES
ncbi:MAG: hypothetical protein RLZZ537_1219 [Pseudomonadota bacterium]|jgi:hypothetical protein